MAEEYFYYIKIDFPAGDSVYFSNIPRYHATINYISTLSAVTPVRMGFNSRKSFQASNYNASFIDRSGLLRNRHYINNTVTYVCENIVKGTTVFSIESEIENFHVKDNVTTLSISTYPRFLDETIPTDMMENQTYPDIVEIARGLPVAETWGIPHSWGDENPDPDGGLVLDYGALTGYLVSVSGAPAVSIAASRTNTYLLGGNHINSVDHGWKGPETIAGTLYNNPTDGRAYFRMDETKIDKERTQTLRFNVHGPESGIVANWIKDPTECIIEILGKFNKPYNTASFAAMVLITKAAGLYPNIVIGGITTTYDFMAAMALNFGFFWHVNHDKELVVTEHPSNTVASIKAFIRDDTTGECNIVGLTWKRRSRFYNKITGRYHYVPATRNYYSTYNVEDAISILMWGERPLTIDFQHVVGSTVPDYETRVVYIAEQYLEYHSAPVIEATLTMDLDVYDGSSVDIGTVVTVEHPDMPSGKNRFHVQAVEIAVMTKTVTLTLQGLDGLPRPALAMDFNSNYRNTAAINPATLTGAVAYTDNGIYGKTAALTHATGNYWTLRNTIAGMPWTTAADGALGCTITMDIATGGHIVMGNGTVWAASKRRWQIYRDTTGHPGVVWVLVGQGDTGPGASYIYSVPDVWTGIISIVVYITPENVSGNSYTQLWVEGEYIGQSTAFGAVGTGTESDLVGALLSNANQGRCEGVSRFQVIEGPISNGQIRLLNEK